MKFIGRMMLFVLVTGFSFGLAIIGCDDEEKNDNNLLTMALAFLQPTTPDKIYIYSAGTHDGFLANRSTADSLCQTAASGITAVSGKTVKKAFISFSGSDQIKDLVASLYQTLPVYGIKTNGTETLLKDSWNNLWTALGINASLSSATDITDVWWSGSDTNGTSMAGSGTCLEWTCNAGSCSTPAAGYLGSHSINTGSTWLNNSANIGCNTNTVYVLCVAY
jgi:hypothetical protein